MPTAFVDSGAWIALIDPDDHWHRPATQFFRTLTRTKLVTSNYVIAETLTWLVHKGLQHRTPQFRRMVRDSERAGFLDILWVTRVPHDEAWDLLEQYDDQDFSFFDCTSFVLAKEAKADFVFAFDSDFRIVGLDVRPVP